MASVPLTHVDLRDSIGALQIGSIFAVFIFGIVTLQVYLYYTRFSEDLWTYKALVVSVWFLEVGHTIGTSYEVYNSTITLYGEPQKLTSFPAIGSTIAIGGLITLLVQGFFAMRLYRVLPKPFCYIGVLCIVMASVRCVASIFLTVKAVSTHNIAQYRTSMAWLITSLLSVGAAIDIIIAVSMLYYLSKKRDQGLERIATVIDRLIAYTIRTGLLTSVSAIIVLICFKTMPNNFIWLALYSFLAKLYSNSLLSALNARQDMREEVSHSVPSIDRYSRSKNPRRGENMTSSHFTYNGAQPIAIEMKTTTKTMQDEADIHSSSVEKIEGLANTPSPYHLRREDHV